VPDDILYVWYFDRQDAIQCSGFNFIQDLPRFMVLLLITQRLSYVAWGLNPLFACATSPKPQIIIEDKDLGTVDLTFDLEAENRMTLYGLRGLRNQRLSGRERETIEATEGTAQSKHIQGHGCQALLPKQSRESEPDILKKVQAIGEKNPDVNGHISEMVWFHKFDETSTVSIRKILGIDKHDRGSRALYIIVFRKLVPITDHEAER